MGALRTLIGLRHQQIAVALSHSCSNWRWVDGHPQLHAIQFHTTGNHSQELAQCGSNSPSSLDPCCFFTWAPCDRWSLQILRNSARSKMEEGSEEPELSSVPNMSLPSQPGTYFSHLQNFSKSQLQEAFSDQSHCVSLWLTLSEYVLKFALSYRCFYFLDFISNIFKTKVETLYVLLLAIKQWHFS